MLTNAVFTDIINVTKGKGTEKEKMKTICIVDDDVHIGEMLDEVLTKNGYRVTRAYSGTEAVMLLSNEKPDLILLDLMLPGLNGEEVLKRADGIPVIIVSAKGDVDSKVNLLLSGAVDYISKPFDTKELLARITVALRAAPDGRRRITAGEITLDDDKKSVSVRGGEIKLTRTEYAILKYLMINSGLAVSKSRLLDRISADTPDCTEESLKIHISNLRKKLREKSDKEYIKTVWGIGFIFTES